MVLQLLCKYAIFVPIRHVFFSIHWDDIDTTQNMVHSQFYLARLLSVSYLFQWFHMIGGLLALNSPFFG